MTASSRKQRRRPYLPQQQEEANGEGIKSTLDAEEESTSSSSSASVDSEAESSIGSSTSSWSAIRSSYSPFMTAALTYGVLLLAFHHVNASAPADTEEESNMAYPSNDDNDTPLFLERVQEGPFGLSNLDLVLFGIFFLLALELLQVLVGGSGKWLGTKLIPVRGKHLDELTTKDLAFIRFNKLATLVFFHVFARYTYYERNIIWDMNNITVTNLILPLPALFIVYDFFYVILHWALHIRGVYEYIHKHHHHQMAPSRATVDAMNVHPLEFFLGEYNHLFALHVCCRFLGIKFHISSMILLLAVSGVLTGLNHTRYDVEFSVFGLKIYDSKAHDVHHRIPQSNYGQFTMLFDYLLGSYRPYDPTDRINKIAQLDPRTGKSYEYMLRKEKLEESR